MKPASNHYPNSAPTTPSSVRIETIVFLAQGWNEHSVTTRIVLQLPPVYRCVSLTMEILKDLGVWVASITCERML